MRHDRGGNGIVPSNRTRGLDELVCARVIIGERGGTSIGGAAGAEELGI